MPKLTHALRQPYLRLTNALTTPRPRLPTPCLADGVILRNFRNNTLIESTKQPPANLSNTTHSNKNSHNNSSAAYATNGSSTSQVVNNIRYIPSEQSCCATGQRVARKNMPCDITNLAVLRKWHNYTNPPSRKLRSKRKIKLSEKISVCSAIFPKDFVLCCKHRDYFKQKKNCQKKPRLQKEKCKKMVRKRFS
ncbi:hypothetical protein Btru_058962 [Bulinus truncatus]|nr:hypothetical protein Btru_058962 [Bulinus truncatus]